MGNSEPDTAALAWRAWRKGDHAKVSIMHIFRTSHRDQDARRANAAADGEAAITTRSRARRDGVPEAELRRLVELDLVSLLNTIQLDSSVSLDDAPLVARSIVNYGFRDLSTVSGKDLSSPQMIETIRRSLLDYEPRLVRDTLMVRILNSESDPRQRLTLHVSAEFMGDPVDVEVAFDAEVDLGAGKLRMSKLRVQS